MFPHYIKLSAAVILIVLMVNGVIQMKKNHHD